MIYKDKKIRNQIELDYKELENYKNSYRKRITLYNMYLQSMQVFEAGVADKTDLDKEDMESKKQAFQIQINKINAILELLSSFLENADSTGNIKVEKKTLNKYNQKYKDVRNDYIINSVHEEDITEKFIYGLMTDMAKTIEKMREEQIKEMEKVNIQKSAEKKDNAINEEEVNYVDEKEKNEVCIKNNNTLLISEKQGKVILPYKAEEVLDIFNKEKSEYSNVEDVIEDKFTRDFSDYKIQFASRYAETIKLVREREHYSIIDAITVASEMMRKRFLHPAIISACRTLNELDVYLDCLDKNELEDFKIFNVKYELYPMVVKSSNKGKREKHVESKGLNIVSIIKSVFSKNDEAIEKAYDK